MIFQCISRHECWSKSKKLEDSFIAYDLGKTYEGYETYLVYMEIKGGSLSATYNENGKLIRVDWKYKDVKLPLLLFILYTKPTLLANC
jgi:hypothetical protein